MDENLKSQVLNYVSVLLNKGAKQNGNMHETEFYQRGFQLAYNLLETKLKREFVGIDSIGTMRISTCALAKRDINDFLVNASSPDEVAIAIQGFKDEMTLFKQYFPENKYPEIYVDDIVRNFESILNPTVPK
ncbi:MAG: hypothetical protein Q8O89_01310 [Nanoarchaeota archaeon]|nr:hypothetical protein [Nanoarchaeota archaeon]